MAGGFGGVFIALLCAGGVVDGFSLARSSPQRKWCSPRMSVQDNVESWKVFVDYNGHSWRGVARSLSVDPILRRVTSDAVLDGHRYVTRFDAEREGAFEEVREWEDSLVEESKKGRDIAADFDGSYSVDYNVHSIGFATSMFAAEAGFAVSDDERVRVVAAYDITGGLCRVVVLEEVKIGSETESRGASRCESDLFDLAGEWRGDATVRRRKGALAVAKQDVVFTTDGERLVRRLTVSDASGSALDSFESYGQTAKSPDGVELVAMDDGTALILLADAGAYALAPLSIVDRTAFFIEAGLFVTENPENRNAQFPISIRRGEDLMDRQEQENSDESPSRHLSRSVRLYSSDGTLASVTTSYHQLLRPVTAAT